jgi:hypothetical protein
MKNLPVMLLAASTVIFAEPVQSQETENPTCANATMTLEQLRRERAKLAAKPRRILFANDGTDMRRYGHHLGMPANCPEIQALIDQGERLENPKEKLRYEFLLRRCIPLVGSQVDAILYNTITGGVPVTQHLHTRLGSPILDEYGQRIHDAGLCPLEMTVEFGHRHGKEVFWTFRVNSLHDGFGSGGHWLEGNKFKMENPDLMLAPRDSKRKRMGWTALNYEEAKVQKLVLGLLEEVCQNYNIDGLDIDFMRFHYLFRNTFEGKPATPKQREILTALMREIRGLTEREGLKRGRPILINARVADSVPYNLDHGIDVETWMKEGLIDLVSMGGRMQLNPFETSIEVAKKHGLPVFSSIESPIGVAVARGNDGGAPPVTLRRNLNALRGRAMEALGAGADGLYILNLWFFFDNEIAIREIGSKETLLGKDKDYFACWGLGEAFGLPHAPYRGIETLCPAMPREIKSGEAVEVSFPMFDDLKAARLAGKEPALSLRLQFEGVTSPDVLTLAANGQALDLSRAAMKDDWLEVPVPEDALITGRNTLSAKSDTLPNAVLKDLILQVRYRQMEASGAQN